MPENKLERTVYNISRKIDSTIIERSVKVARLLHQQSSLGIQQLEPKLHRTYMNKIENLFLPERLAVYYELRHSNHTMNVADYFWRNFIVINTGNLEDTL